MPTDDLHARLLEVVRERKRVAEAAASEDVAWHSPYTCWTGLAARVVALVITNDPATIIRHCDADLRRLERHAPAEYNDGPGCRPCGGLWPCDDVGDLAAAYGVEVEG